MSRVLIADDSELMRKLLSDIIDASLEFRVIAEARTGYETIRLVHEANPDIVTLDLHMPDLGGLDALSYIMSEAPRPVVVVSSHVSGMAQPALDALERGALEIVAKPAGDQASEVDVLGDRVLDALRAARMARVENLRVRPRRAPTRAAATAQVNGPRCAVAMAASTGGPRALIDIITQLPADLPAAILIVQHLPAVFTGPFAERMAGLSGLPVSEARDNELLRAGSVYVAPGGVHLSLGRAPDGITCVLEESPPLWGVRPAADVLFTAVAKHFGPASAAVVLTGMGRDGADGLRAIRDVGGWTAVQDAASCVVYGMPKAAMSYAAEELPLAGMAQILTEKIRALAQRRRR